MAVVNDAVWLIEHGAAEPLPGLPRAWWPLSDRGRAAAIAMAGARLWRHVGEIYCSGELAAFETAHLIAPRIGANVTAIEALSGPMDGRSEDEPVGDGAKGDDGAPNRRVTAAIAEVRTWTDGPIAVILRPGDFAAFAAWSRPVGRSHARPPLPAVRLGGARLARAMAARNSLRP